MKPSALLAYFGSQAAIARTLGCSQPSVNEWFEKDSVPEGRQYQAQLATNGELVADRPADRAAALGLSPGGAAHCLSPSVSEGAHA
ncbi:Cro/CI family transcriptional regulator [Pseudorhodoferax sp. Leaf274]|uniref:Cro/CI family transcriptional regulator n=1 Tax=Pseudorhodoferax sp. Leaf274 TaxID=1736318 RepID=UPI0009E6AAC5